MGLAIGANAQARVEAIYQNESRRVYATLVRLLGDFDLAEDALHDAFIAALTQWPREGIPANPRAWLVSAGRFKAIDHLRRRAKFDASLATLAEQMDAGTDDWDAEREAIEDDRLRLIFTCCNPALAADARIALTLREVCGLTTEEIARAFLIPTATLAQRIVRAKAKIRTAKIPYRVPEPAELPERLDTVLHVIYLVFTEGYAASAGPELTRADLSGEAIRLGRLLVQLLPEPEAKGLLSLMLLQESRRAARSTPDGEIVLLEDQDRSKWNWDLIAEGLSLVNDVLATGRAGVYTLQAAIAGVHASARRPGENYWGRIVSFYDQLLLLAPSPVVALNRAVAVAMSEGPDVGLGLVDDIIGRGELGDYHLAHAARADLLRRLGRIDDARSAYSRALELALQEPERRFLQRRLSSLG